MPNTRLSHEQCRHKVCVICLGKGTRTITSWQKDMIQKNIFTKYKENQEILPCVICDTCRINIDSGKTNASINHTKLLNNLKSLSVDPAATSCSCEICHVAKLTGNRAKRKTSCKRRAGRPTKEEPTVTICKKCMDVFKRGHKCNMNKKYHNVKQLLSPKSHEVVTSSFIQQNTKLRGVVTSDKMSIKTPGRPLNVAISGIKKLKKDNSQISNKTLLDMQVRRNLSDNSIMGIASDLRQGGGDVEPRFERELFNRGKLLSDFFESKEIPWVYKEKDSDVVINVTRQSILCKDVKGLVDYICQKRKLADALFRVGIDGGQGFLKVCLNIIDTCAPVVSRRKRSRASSQKKGIFQDSGVKRLFIIGIVEDKCEMYENLREIIENLDLNKSLPEYILASDLKVCNIMVGIQSHTATYPCTWCYSKSPHKKKSKLRTYGEILKFHEAYVKGGRKDAPKYFNCVHAPLIKGKESDEIIDLVAPAPLHLLLGVANTLLDKLQEKWPHAYTWAARHNIVKKNYHGGKMEGYACKQLLRKAHILELDVPRRFTGYARAMCHFKDVVDACFLNELKDDYLIQIQRFRTSYESLKINVTPKVHAVFEHVGEFCTRKNMGLALFAEQASESVHRDFKNFWNRCKRDMSHPDYTKNLRSCVVKYNSSHVGE